MVVYESRWMYNACKVEEKNQKCPQKEYTDEHQDYSDNGTNIGLKTGHCF